MDLFVPCGSAAYFSLLGLVLLARGADFLSTWVATPHLVLEANPLARALGWRWGAVVNAVLAACVALWPLPAVIVATASLLVAARNFQSAWLARSLGESAYRSWLGERLAETRRGLFLACVVAQASLVAFVGALLVYFNPVESFAAAVGLGIVTYALATVIFPVWGAWKMWRDTREPQ